MKNEGVQLDSSGAVVSYPLNEAGRDFIVGDIHGSFTMLERALEKASFDASRDRLFCVGDLVDRGPESGRVLSFLDRMHCVRGNHEEMLLGLYADGAVSERRLQLLADDEMIGMRWWLNESADSRRKILAAFHRLPLAIEVQTSIGVVGIVHAEVPPGIDWKTFCKALGDSSARVVWHALWGKTRLEHGNRSGVAGIARVFSGHVVQRDGVLGLGNVFFIDTGAVFRDIMAVDFCRLTMVNIAMRSCDITAPLADDPDIDVRDVTPQV